MSQFFVVGMSLTVRPMASARGRRAVGWQRRQRWRASAPIGEPLGSTISRTATRLPGSTRPANTACCSVMPAVPGPKLPDVALFSIRSVLPISEAGFAGSVRTVMATRRAWSPSMMSSLPRPSIRSLPPPPRRMLPSAQTVPDLRLPEFHRSRRSGHWLHGRGVDDVCERRREGVTNLLSPAMRATPAGIECVAAGEPAWADDSFRVVATDDVVERWSRSRLRSPANGRG